MAQKERNFHNNILLYIRSRIIGPKNMPIRGSIVAPVISTEIVAGRKEVGGGRKKSTLTGQGARIC